jgi:hypothetical protein
MTASDEVVVDNCPNCGAPLKLDTAGDCIWCHAHVRVAGSPVVVARESDAASAMRVLYGNPLEDEPDDIMLLQPVSNLLTFLWTSGQEAAVQDFISHWEHKDAVTPLLHAVRAAGTRATVAAEAKPGFNEFGDNSALYTSDEWWTIALATDTLSLLAGLPGVDPLQAVTTANEVRNVHDTYADCIAKATPPAGDDASALRAMRGSVPSAAPEPAPADEAPADEAPASPSRPERHHFWQRRHEG